MPKRNRNTLKNFFREGALPTAGNFADMVDSNLNLIDEGFDKSKAYGLEISPLGDYESLLSFFRNNDPEHDPQWTISYDRDQGQLLFHRYDQDKKPQTVLTLNQKGEVGINCRNPQWGLDVNGIIRSEGRTGMNPTQETTVPADGQWYDITGELNGCQAFEVMAGAGDKGTGNYALMRAIAMNTFNPRGWIFNFLKLKNRIRYQQAYYNSRANKLKLRWFGKGRQYRLQLRSNCDYGNDIRISFSLTKLWFDEDMRESWSGEASSKYNQNVSGE